MNLNLNQLRSKEWIEQATVSFHEKTKSMIVKYPIGSRLIGPLFGAAYGLILVSLAISSLAERLFKGGVNVIGSRFSQRFNADIGWKMLKPAKLGECALAVVLSPLLFIMAFAINTAVMSFFPTDSRREEMNRALL